ncbi:MAG: LytTR family DNA-binding domain-containing protein [Bryobacteraceae bacterium]|jgi:DNA-binding LytR/AlgR family response regulator
MDRPIKTIIADDEQIARRVLREELELLPDVSIVGEAENGPQVLQQIVELRPDLVFLDLQMPGMEGFEVIRNLSGPRLPVIVIVTAFHQHAIEAFEAGAIDYLLKPVSEARLRRAVERAKNLIGKPLEIAQDLAKIASASEAQNTARRKLVGRAGREYYLLDADEVLALQAEGELVWIVTPKRRFMASQTLRTLETSLQPLAFQRVHRNAIVNINHVRKVTALTSHRWMLTLSNEQQFVVSKRQAHNIRRLLER